MAEKNANSVGAYGGLGAQGLDFGQGGDPASKTKAKEIEGSFSGAAMKYAPKIVDSEDEEFEDQEEEVTVQEPEVPKPEI